MFNSIKEKTILCVLIVLLVFSISCSKEKVIEHNLAEYMSPSEIEESAKNFSIAYIPIGAMEWHNEHLPLGLDTIKAYELCKRICAQTGGIIFPPIYFGSDTIGTVGSMPVPTTVEKDLFRATIENLISQGFRVIVTLTGHTPEVQIENLKNIAKEIEEKNKYVKVISLTEGTFVHDEEIELFGHYEDHAAAGETSLLQYLRPELVHLERLKYPIKPKKEGILWDPRYGSKENGEKIVKLIVERSVDHIKKEKDKLFAEYPEAPKPEKDEKKGMSILDDMQGESRE
jgi:creatinine amidohydrolase